MREVDVQGSPLWKSVLRTAAIPGFSIRNIYKSGHLYKLFLLAEAKKIVEACKIMSVNQTLE